MDLSKEVTLSEASESDSGRLAEISKRAFDSDVDFGAPNTGGPTGYDSDLFYSQMLRFLNCFLILVEDELIGGTMVKVGGKLGVIERVFIDPSYQRKGIGTRAMQLIMEKYPEVVLWTVGTAEWNNRTKLFYEKLGFSQVGWDYSDPGFRGRWYEKRVGEGNVMIPISSIKEGMNNVNVEGKVVEKSFARMVRAKKSRESLMVSNAAVEDESGRVVMTLWDKQIILVKVASRIRVENGYTTSYSGVTQLNVGYGKLIVLI
ncbi:MAG: GNAT family N-acetyltransferase [Candidatus Bathyarchaeota archaeon]|nr:GNAT family N-acetyltransferase [Candidatus Bathyarchaeota archaeon]